MLAMVLLTAWFILTVFTTIQEAIWVRDTIGPQYFWHGAVGSMAVVLLLYMVYMRGMLWLSRCYLRQGARARMRANAAAVCGNE